MRTAIFVYETTELRFETHETDLELSCMNAATVPLPEGVSSQTLAQGIYKVVSSQSVQITGNDSAFDLVVTITNKENDPEPPPPRATELGPIDAIALHAFFAVPEAKELANP